MLKKAIFNFEEILGGIFLCILVCLVSSNVFCRLFLDTSYAFLDEASALCYAYVIFLGASAVYKRFGHSSIDIVVRLFPVKLQAVIALFSTLILTFTTGMTFYLCIGYMIRAHARITSIMHMPYSYQAFSAVLGFGLMFVHSVMFLVNIFRFRDYYHEKPLYPGLFQMDSVEDQVELAQQAHMLDEDAEGGDGDA